MAKAIRLSFYFLVLGISICLTTVIVEAQAPSMKKFMKQEEKSVEGVKEKSKDKPTIPLGPEYNTLQKALQYSMSKGE